MESKENTMMMTGTTTGFEALVVDVESILTQHFSDLRIEAREEAVAESVAMAWVNYQSMDRRGVLVSDAIDLATVESRKVSPADLAAFRLDFAEFMRTLTDRQRGVALRLAAGFTTADVAAVYGISAPAISQHRRAREEKWIEFQGG
jgi:DNA-binding NarL/FixJ family response regulator